MDSSIVQSGRQRRSALLALLMVAALLSAWAPSLPLRSPPSAITPTPLTSAPFGINTHIATRYTDLPTIGAPADLVVRSGAGWAREDIHWYRVQPTYDTWDWTFTDAAIGALVTRGVRIVGVIGHPPGWATADPYDPAGGFSFSAPDPDRFAAFAQTVAIRYSRYITHWEIWNEPDNPSFWRPAPDPAAYAKLLMRSAAAIRAAVPGAKILLGGINPFDTHFLHGVAAAGAWSSFDILAIHPYVQPTAPEAGNLAAAVESVRAMGRTLGQRPIWVTEVGWRSQPEARGPPGSADPNSQAAFLVRATLLLWQAGVERIFWYNLKDDPEGDTFGMVGLGTGRADLSQLKPAFYAFQTMSRQLAGSQFVDTRDLFQRTTVLDFEQFGVWVRGDQPNGRLGQTDAAQHTGRSSAQLSYQFPSRGNDYVVFRRQPAAPIPGSPYAIGVWVYGDGSGHALKLWLRDRDGEILQYALGAVGPPGWRFLQAQLTDSVAPWNRISEGGNGRLDGPLRVEAIVLDDAPDSAIGGGTIYLDDVIALSGPEAYDLRLQGRDSAIDVLWAARPVLVSIASRGATAQVTEWDGRQRTVAVSEGRLVLQIGPQPIYVRHTR